MERALRVESAHSLLALLRDASNALAHPVCTDPVSTFEVRNEVRDVFATADDSMGQAMAADEEVGYLENFNDSVLQFTSMKATQPFAA